MPKLMTAVNPPRLAKPAGYSHAWEVQGGKTLYISGQVAFDKDGAVVGKGLYDEDRGCAIEIEGIAIID